MFFAGKRINQLGRYTRRADLARPQYIYFVSDNEDETFSRVGFPTNAAVGSTILPNAIGPISRFNADGRWIVHKDRPLEERVVGQRIWRWREFRGRYDHQDRERIVDQSRMCYPRTFVEPPSLEMSIHIADGRQRLVTEVAGGSDPELLKHAINLYLEYFGQCHVTDTPDEIPIVIPTRVNWRMLPPGGDPWARAEHAVAEKAAPYSEDMRYIITERQRFICGLNPQDVYVGEGGFSDYLAYVFPELNKTVMESVARGNAIYIFTMEWQRLSQLSKREILADNLHLARIVHATGWPERLVAALRAEH